MTAAEKLRRAAEVLRERAEAATPGPWTTPDGNDEYINPTDVVSVGEPGKRWIICEHAGQDAPFIATMNPTVALAVADWLDDAASNQEAFDRFDGRSFQYHPRPDLAVADAILAGVTA